MVTYCAPLVADLFVFCYERDFMLSLSDNNQAYVINHLLYGIDDSTWQENKTLFILGTTVLNQLWQV